MKGRIRISTNYLSIYVGCRGSEERPAVVLPYDFSNATWTDVTGANLEIKIDGVTKVNISKVSKIIINGSATGDNISDYSYTLDNYDINGTYILRRNAGKGAEIYSCTVSVYDADDNLLQSAELSQ